MTADWLTETARIFGVGAAVALVLAAAAYTVAKVLRSDRTLTGIIERLEEERDYYRDELKNERNAAAEMEKRLNAKLDQQAAEASSERKNLIDKIEELRRELQPFTIQRSPE